MILILFQALEANLLEAYLQRRIQSRAFYMISLCIWLLFDDIYAIVRIAMIIGLIYVIFKRTHLVVFMHQIYDLQREINLYVAQHPISCCPFQLSWAKYSQTRRFLVSRLASNLSLWQSWHFRTATGCDISTLSWCFSPCCRCCCARSRLELPRVLTRYMLVQSITSFVSCSINLVGVQNSLPFARNACSCVCIALLVYLVSGTSWFSTVAVFATFLPRASKTILDWGSLALMIVLGGFVVIRPKQWLLENHLKPWWLAHIGCVLWAVYCVHDFFSTSSWWFHLFVVSLGLFFLVPDTWLAIATVGMSLLKKSIAVIGDPYLVGPTVLGMVLFGYAIVYEIVARLCCRRRAAADESTPADEASSASQSS
jgi:hypothetical protein